MNFLGNYLLSDEGMKTLGDGTWNITSEKPDGREVTRTYVNGELHATNESHEAQIEVSRALWAKRQLKKRLEKSLKKQAEERQKS